MTIMNMPGVGPSMQLDDSLEEGEEPPRRATFKRIRPYLTQHPVAMALVLAATIVDALIATASPLILKVIIDDGIRAGRPAVVTWLSLAIAGAALLDALAIYVQTLYSAKVGEGLVYSLRTEAYEHVLSQSVAFFTHTQTGALISRLNNDILGTQQAITVLLTQSVSTVATIVLVLSAMFYLSWQISVAALVLIPVFLLPAKLAGRAISRLARYEMDLEADMSSTMSERFNLSGALLVKLYGRPDLEAKSFSRTAVKIRDASVLSAVYARIFFILATLLTAMTTALVYGLGGWLTMQGTLEIGTLVAMVALLLRLYGPINQLSSIQVSYVTAVVSFDRIFEVLDLEPQIADRSGAVAVPGPEAGGAPAGPAVEFDHVWFRYPSTDEVSLRSLEPDGPARRPAEGHRPPQTLRDVSFVMPPGTMTALVGPSGAGKTSIAGLIPRLYDARSGVVRVGGADVRDVTLESLRDAVGVVTQDSHLFHDTLRANLLYARPGASEDDLREACRAARIWDVVEALPDRLDTLVGDRGHRLSGGEKQRIALARLMLKAPSVVILDEATAHLDSESEAAVQLALRTVLAGRTSLVIAHRLHTVRDADQILVVEAGQIRERGTHESLMAAGDLYADLVHTQLGVEQAMATGARPVAD